MAIENYFSGKNEWALIVGASSGMGKAIAEEYARQGLNLLLIHRDSRARMEDLSREFETLKSHGVEVFSYNINALEPAEIARMLERHQNVRFRVLVHSLALGNLRAFSLDAEANAPAEKTDFDITLDAMAFNIWQWVKQVLHYQLFLPDARVIALTSEGNKRHLPGYGLVAAAKAALESIIRYMAVELAPAGVKVNAIQAGVTDTPALKRIPGAEKLLVQAEKRNPQKRLTKTSDIAQIALLLATEEASWINGSILVADGGESLV